MTTSGRLTAICRVAAVLAVAGVIAMHGLTTGHHAGLHAASGGAGAGAHLSMTVDALITGTPSDDFSAARPSGAPIPSEKLVEVCMAVLLVAATLLLLLATTRRRLWPGAALPSSRPPWARHVARPRAPCLFTLGVLRT